ncbi:MAG: hypothetical protein ACO1RX_12565 [Candidatus Sericytochromatia bacterium]
MLPAQTPSPRPLYGRLLIAQTWNGHAVPRAEQIALELELRTQGLLFDFEAPFYDDPAPQAPPGSLDGLWDYEVVELFVGQAGTARYTEIELGPHGHHLVLCLNGIRQRESAGHDLRHKVYRAPGRWGATALVPFDLLPPQPWVFNAYAIHGTGSTRSYRAAHAVPGPAPDFHQIDRFQALT